MLLNPYFKNTGLAFVFMITLLQRETSTAKNGFGSGLKESVKNVENCPDSKEKWREAVEKKKCPSFAFKLSKPEEFMYHCVINSYLNQTVELCAQQKIIFGGSCTEYSASANRIQGSLKALCTNSSPPCPDVYNSTQSYKYQGCYHLSKKNQTKIAGKNTSGDLKPVLSVMILGLLIIAD